MNVIFIVVFCLVAPCVFAEKTIKVFVALCDNETQGIVKVGRVIGDGDKPDANLYWGCSDGLPKVFGKSAKWKKLGITKDIDENVLRLASFKHLSTDSKLEASAYRGSEIKQCFLDYEKAVVSGKYDLVCFIGHNALMDFPAPKTPENKQGKKCDVVVLCCLSDQYFSERIRSMGGRPILMTRSLMYPGSFILHDVLEDWFTGKDVDQFRSTAGKAYHKNQVKINKRLSVKNATSVFAKIE